MKFETTHKPLSTFSISAMMNVVLLLLIFFLLTSQFVFQSGLKVKVKETVNEDTLQMDKAVVLVTAEKRIFYGTEEIIISDLDSKLKINPDDPGNVSLIIRADKSVEIDLIVKIMDAAKLNGFQNVSIQTVDALY